MGRERETKERERFPRTGSVADPRFSLISHQGCSVSNFLWQEGRVSMKAVNLLQIATEEENVDFTLRAVSRGQGQSTFQTPPFVLKRWPTVGNARWKPRVLRWPIDSFCMKHETPNASLSPQFRHSLERQTAYPGRIHG